jgi:hypothetical protein
MDVDIDTMLSVSMPGTSVRQCLPTIFCAARNRRTQPYRLSPTTTECLLLTSLEPAPL